MSDSSRVRKSAQDLIKYARTRLWTQSQWPDPELIHRQSGMFGVAAYLHQCWSPERTKEILLQYGADIHPDAWPIGPNITLHEHRESLENLSVGPFAHIGKEVFLDLTDRLIIEQSVAVGMRAVLLTHLNVGDGYPDKPVAQLIPKKEKPTILRRGCSVGAGAIVLCGVEIGEDAVVNAGVVVDQDVPPRTIVTSSRHKADYTMPERFFAKLRKKSQRADAKRG